MRAFRPGRRLRVAGGEMTRSLLAALIVLGLAASAHAQDEERPPSPPEPENAAIPTDAPPRAPSPHAAITAPDEDIIGPHHTAITLGLALWDPADPLTFLKLEPELERKFDRRTSWYVAPRFAPLVERFAIGIKIGVRYYFDGSSPEGWFIGPRIAFHYIEVRQEGTFSSRVVFESALTLGYSWHIFDRIVLSFGLALGYETRSVRLTNGERVSENGASPDVLRLNLGGAF